MRAWGARLENGVGARQGGGAWLLCARILADRQQSTFEAREAANTRVVPGSDVENGLVQGGCGPLGNVPNGLPGW